MDIVSILVGIEASKRTSITKKTKLPFVSRWRVNMAPLKMYVHDKPLCSGCTLDIHRILYLVNVCRIF